jgi:hypothetical protein
VFRQLESRPSLATLEFWGLTTHRERQQQQLAKRRRKSATRREV